MLYSTDKNVNELVKSLINQGWTYKRHKNHGKLQTPNRQHTIVLSLSPSDRRVLMNVRADIRRVMRQLEVA